MQDTKNTSFEVGIALSGGGARGIAHLGVLKALEERGIKPQIIAGVSAGSIIGSLYSAGLPIPDILQLFDNCKFSDMAEISVPKDGFFKIDRFKKILREVLPVTNLEELPIPMYICATDIDHGCTKIFDSGSIVERIAASCSIPVIFKPTRIDGVNYVDGGVLRNLPAWAIRPKCNHLIGVNCSPFVNHKIKSSIIEIAQRSYELMSKVNTVMDMKMCDTLILIKTIAHHKSLDTKNLQKIFECGYNEACRVLDSAEKSDFNDFLI